MKNNKNILLTALLLWILFPVCLFAQNSNNKIAEGNQLYRSNDFEGAQKTYEEVLKTLPESEIGNYNLGNTYYQQQQYDNAIAAFQKAAELASSPESRAKSMHNLGNAYIAQKNYEAGIQAYKQALRDNPGSADTKYNLAYAQTLLKEQKKKQEEQQKKEEEKKKQPEQQNKKEEDKQNPSPQKQQEQPAKPKEYSKDELERILQSLNNDDKEVQDKVNKQKAQNGTGDAEKDW